MRRRPPCEYQPACPGCPRFGQDELPEEGVRRLRELSERFHGPAVELHPCSGLGHRYRSRLSVRGRVGALQMGIFRAGSHELVHIPRCSVHHPSIASLIERIIEIGNQLRVAPYDEASHTGTLRAVQFAVQPATGQVQLTLLVRADRLDSEHLDAALLELCERLTPKAHSVFLGALPEKNNSLFAKELRHMAGPSTMDDWVGGAQVFYPPDAFGQANPIMHAQVVERVRSLIPMNEGVSEYYAGVGTFGLGLCRPDRKVVFNEMAEGSLRGLVRGLAELGLEAQVLKGPAGQFADAYDVSDCVIVDPPRKGLDGPLLQRLKTQPPRRLVYLSCGLPALLREADELLSTGRFQIHHLSAWAYFPFTQHIETLLVLERREARA